ncbi:hypothetical protein SAMN02910369_02871 [Lachnospiraceae bacterium NE2001]|nr:hypothetical protein SAMN02910369_02871 [Lachnospiraceae bacterium NE2001]
MKRWIPFLVFACIALLCTIVTAIIGVEAYLALTGLDLLVMAKKTAPKLSVLFAIISLVFWVISIVVLFVTKPYKSKEKN